MTVFGYLRVSSPDGEVEIQRDALAAAGATKFYEEKVTATSIAPRTQFQKLMKKVQAGDTLLCYRLDRAFRNLRDMCNALHELDSRGVKFQSLSEPWATTGTPASTLLLHVLGAVSSFEAAMIKLRTEEGKARYVANGGKLGRRSKLSDAQRRMMLKMLGENRTQDEVAAVLGVTQQTVSYQRKKLEA